MNLGYWPGRILEAYSLETVQQRISGLGCVPGPGEYSDAASETLYTEFRNFFPILVFQEADKLLILS